MLDTVLGKLARQHDPNVLVGFDKADDAGVYRIGPDQALVQTVDFFTPIVDDPYTFGQIAATNSLSDVYAMGGRPLTALAMVCFPEKGDFDVLERILAGGLSKDDGGGMHDRRRAQHSRSRDQVRLLRYGDDQSAARADEQRGVAGRQADIYEGDRHRRDLDGHQARQGREKWIEAATRSMTTLNKVAAEVAGRIPPQRTREDGEAIPFRVHSMTDITGFGLIGHAREMALGSDVSLRLFASKIPLLDGALECVRGGFVPGGLTANREFAECW